MTLLLLPFALLSTIKNCFGLNWSPVGDILYQKNQWFYSQTVTEPPGSCSLWTTTSISCDQGRQSGLREVISSITREKKQLPEHSWSP